MSNELAWRRDVVKALRRAGLDARPVENPADPGFPDIEFVGGTMELKELDRWPVRSGTPVRVPLYKSHQRIWHSRRAAAGGLVYVLLRVGFEFVLLPGAWAAVHLGESPRDVLYHASLAHWRSKCDALDGIAEVLRKEWKA